MHSTSPLSRSCTRPPPLRPSQGLIGDVVVPGVQGEVEVVARPPGGVGPGEQVVAGELVGKGHQRPGADVALGVPTAWRVALRTVELSPAPGAVLLRQESTSPVRSSTRPTESCPWRL